LNRPLRGNGSGILVAVASNGEMRFRVQSGLIEYSERSFKEAHEYAGELSRALSRTKGIRGEGLTPACLQSRFSLMYEKARSRLPTEYTSLGEGNPFEKFEPLAAESCFNSAIIKSNIRSPGTNVLAKL